MNDAYITPEELIAAGVKASDEELQDIADGLNEKIDELIGQEIVDSLTPEDVDKLAELQDDATDEDIANWIIEHVPDYPEIMSNNKDIVLGEYVDGLDK